MRPDIRSDIAAPVILDMAICNKPELRLRHRTVSYHSCQRTAESDGVKPMDSAECGCVFRPALELLTFQVRLGSQKYRLRATAAAILQFSPDPPAW